ncbi:MAG: AarF/ABC1/UbiB kinase family protein [Thermoanaerobaculia bacterium]|nr:AarF/ABC1/UbiB kinase family protein [Thermoanaerobaculia bacterium]
MAISVKPTHLKRYKDLGALLVKYGRSDLVRSLDLPYEPGAEEAVADPDAAKLAEQLAKDLEKLGPTFIKLGQLLSTRADLLPVPYIEALARLQDQVEPFSFGEVEKIVEAELGVRISKAFAEFESQPLAAASLGQVHRATLRDGRPVAVKVQRPAIREQILEDLDVFEEVGGMLDRHTEAGDRFQFQKMVQEFRKTLVRELDYRAEAQNLVTLGQNLDEFERILVPRPVEDFTTSKVLTMDFIEGTKVTALGPLGRIELDGSALAEDLFHAYLKQILIDGFFHADPHPGNVFVTPDHRLALVDLGMVARIPQGLREELLKLLLAISEGNGEEAATRAMEIGERRDPFDEREFRRQVGELVGRYEGVTVKELQVGRLVMVVSRVSSETGVRMPPELMMLAKTLLHLDTIGRTLDPEFNPTVSIRKNTAELMRRQMWKSASPANLAATLLEARDFVARLPGRVNRVLDLVSRNEVKLHVDAIDEALLIDGLHKIANRITMGLILAALIVGAAMLMRVETSFRILGYPGFAILCFLAAAGGGLALVVSIVKSDLRVDSRKKRPR